MTMSRRPPLRLVAAALALAAAAAGCAGNSPPEPRPAVPDTVSAVRGVHDPVIAKENGVYWVYSTGRGVPIRRSRDLLHWDSVGRVFTNATPPWALDSVPGVQFPWAPDIAYFNGRWHLYYSLSTFGSQRSAIGVATNAVLDPSDARYRWEDQGQVVKSVTGDSHNAIDPNVAFDADGAPWLAWGSFWTGIKMRRLDPATGKLSATDTTLHSLAARGTFGAIEAPFIVRRGAWFYLFVSFDACCQGSASTYNVRVGRASAITGPYVDRAGVAMMNGGGTVVLAGSGRVRGPGHNAVLQDGDRDYMVHHFYDDLARGTPTLQIRPITWSEDGWPQVGEPLALPPTR